MRPTTLQLLTASLLVANLGFAQGHLPPPWAGKPNGLGLPDPDPLASGNYWGSTPPVPIQDGGRQFGNLPPGFHPMQPGGPPHSDGHGGGSGAAGAPKDIYPSGNQGFPQHIGIPGAPPSVADTIALVPPGGLQLENDYPMHPTQASMYTYVPQTFKKGNPVVVALHPCDGSALRYFGENRGWTHAADLKGFMMIYPNSPPGTNGCWDVSSEASLKHDGGGDSQSVANMVKYAQQKYGCSEHQVYVIGHSSGAMLTQVLGVTYPDVFLAAAAISGVPAGCFRTVQVAARDNNATCTGGALHESPDYWVKQARNMYPGYRGSFPRMMLVHGKADPIINFDDHLEAIKQWCGLHNLNPSNPSKVYKLPDALNHEVFVYGSDVMAIAADGVGHDPPCQVDLTTQFFGL
ncbi:hypothetical protein NDA16_005172 [Ustilago loliicola]|nr:hypothetical protein NDA16_005172 [Ustilago loliicola]